MCQRWQLFLSFTGPVLNPHDNTRMAGGSSSGSAALVRQDWATFRMAVIAVAPTGKASFVSSYVQTRLKGQYNAK